jgi:hypothetical protein
MIVANSKRFIESPFVLICGLSVMARSRGAHASSSVSVYRNIGKIARSNLEFRVPFAGGT